MEERFNMTKAAIMIPYSKRNFLRLKSDEFFPPARTNGSGQPYYTMVDIERCRQIVLCGVGHNGVERNLYGERTRRKSKVNQKRAQAKPPLSPAVDFIVKRLKAFGVENAISKAETIQGILQDLFPLGEPPQQMRTVAKVAKALRSPPAVGMDSEN